MTDVDLGCGGANDGDVIETTCNAEASSGEGNIQSDNIPDADVTPNWRPVDRVLMPYDGVDEKDEATEASPHHKQAHPNSPS